MDRLSDSDLFTSPLTFMGAPYGRPGHHHRSSTRRRKGAEGNLGFSAEANGMGQV